jgi:hypothetical protein
MLAYLTALAAGQLPSWLNSPGVILLAAGLFGLVGTGVDILFGPASHGVERSKLWGVGGGLFGLGLYVGLQVFG